VGRVTPTFDARLAWAVAILLLAELPLLLPRATSRAFVKPIVVVYSLAIIASDG